jgi:hypothetical protein
MAKKLLRKSLTTTERLKQTVEVMRYFENEVRRINLQHVYEARQNQRQDFFRQTLLADVVHCDETEHIWFYAIDGTDHPLFPYANAKRIVKKFNLYAAYMAFIALPEDVYKEIEDEYNNGIPDERRRSAYLDNNQRIYYDKIHALTQESQFRGTLQMRAASFEGQVAEENWMIQGSTVTGAQLRSFYEGLERQLEPLEKPVPKPDPTPEGWVCPKCGRTNDADFLLCPICGAKPPEPVPTPTPEGWVCPKCGRTNDADFLLCPKCGTEPPAPVPWVCPKCGRTNDADFLVCPKCGTERP